MKKALALNAPVLLAAAIAAMSSNVKAATFAYNDSIFIGAADSVYKFSDGIGVTVRAFDANGAQKKLDKDFLFGMGVNAGVEGSGFLGLPILDLNMAVDGGEFLRFDFNKAVNLTGFHLWDMPFGSNQLSINGKTFSTAGTGPFASLGAVTSLTFRSISDDFRVKSLTVTSAVPAIPEPSTYALMLLGLAGVAAVASRKKA